MEKKLLSIDKQESERLCQYGGVFDLVNGTEWSKNQERQLKIGALFYKHIFVPDGFFHCYGPIHTYFSNIIEKSKYTIDSDPIINLLKHGIIVPDLRYGDSLYNNWKTDDKGISKGKYLILKENDGEKVLQLIDEYSSIYTHWPSLLNPESEVRYGHILNDVFIKKPNPFQINIDFNTKDLTRNEIIKHQDFIIKFIEFLDNHYNEPSFRRGDIEQFIAKKLGITFSSYDEIIKRVNWKDPTTNALYSLGYYLLSVSSTTYEAFQASSFSTIGSLFPLHDHQFAEVGFYDYLDKFSELNCENYSENLLEGYFDIDKLKINEIIRFRLEGKTSFNENLYDEYFRVKKEIRNPGDGQKFIDVNERFIEFMKNEFIPCLLNFFPKYGSTIENSLNKTSNTLLDLSGISILLKIVFNFPIETIVIAGIPIVSVLALGAGLSRRISNTKIIKSLDQYIISKKIDNIFTTNHYSVWRKK